MLDVSLLRELSSIKGLSCRDNSESTDEAHQEFMRRYKSAFPDETSTGRARKMIKNSANYNPRKQHTWLPRVATESFLELYRNKRNLSVPDLDEQLELQKKQTLFVLDSCLRSIYFEVAVNKTRYDTFDFAENKKIALPALEQQHDIRIHTAKLHSTKTEISHAQLIQRSIAVVQKLAVKPPYQRTHHDNTQLFKALRQFRTLKEEISDDILNEMSKIAYSETYPDAGLSAFGHSGLMLVVSGSCHPVHRRWFLSKNDSFEGFCDSIERDLRIGFTSGSDAQQSIILKPGDIFGTVQEINLSGEQVIRKRLLAVETREPNCVFLKFRASDFKRLFNKIASADTNKRINLVKSIEKSLFSHRKYNWTLGLTPRCTLVPLERLAEVMEWVTYPAKTVLLKEGYPAPYLGYLERGACTIYRKLDVMQSKKQGTHRESVQANVSVRSIQAPYSFGELSVLEGTAVGFTMISETEVTIAAIKPAVVKTFDEVTLQLLKLAENTEIQELRPEEIQDKYIQRKNTQDWMQIKSQVLNETISRCGIIPGAGKWKHFKDDYPMTY